MLLLLVRDEETGESLSLSSPVRTVVRSFQSKVAIRRLNYLHCDPSSPDARVYLGGDSLGSRKYSLGGCSV